MFTAKRGTLTASAQPIEVRFPLCDVETSLKCLHIQPDREETEPSAAVDPRQKDTLDQRMSSKVGETQMIRLRDASSLQGA